MTHKCDVCEEIVDGGVGCSDGVFRCWGCAEEDGFDPNTGERVSEQDGEDEEE